MPELVVRPAPVSVRSRILLVVAVLALIALAGVAAAPDLIRYQEMLVSGG